MNPIISRFLIVIVLLSSLFACSETLQHSCVNPDELRKWLSENGKIKVLASTEMIADIVQQVGGNSVDVISLIQGQLDPHSYQLVKGDDEKLARADLIFYNGLMLEHGPSLQKYLTESVKATSLGDIISEESPELIIRIDGQTDPHIWMDISLWAKIVDPIVEVLQKYFPEKQASFQERGALVKSSMLSKHKNIISAFESIPEEKRYLVTSHDAFNYFARAYLALGDGLAKGQWQSRVAAPEGLAPDSQLSVTDIQGIIEYLEIHKVNVIFPESNVSSDSIKKIIDAGKSKGMQIVIAEKALYADAMGCDGSDGDSYLKMMQHNANVIIDYLRQ